MSSMFDGTTIPLLEKIALFADRRHDALTANVANIDTPNYNRRDLPVEAFQKALREAIADGQSRVEQGVRGDERRVAIRDRWAAPRDAVSRAAFSGDRGSIAQPHVPGQQQSQHRTRNDGNDQEQPDAKLRHRTHEHPIRHASSRDSRTSVRRRESLAARPVKLRPKHVRTLDISTSGLIGERQRMNAIADNLANLNTTRDADGKPSPFQRRFVTFAAQSENPADASRRA